MRRIVVPALIAAVPLAAADATDTNYGASVKGGGTLDFTAVVSHGAVRQVGAFSYDGVAGACRHGGAGMFEGGTTRFVRVRRRLFHITFQAGGQHASIRGELGHTRKTIAGTIRIRGGVPPRHKRCDSGIHKWTARATKPG